MIRATLPYAYVATVLDPNGRKPREFTVRGAGAFDVPSYRSSDLRAVSVLRREGREYVTYEVGGRLYGPADFGDPVAPDAAEAADRLGLDCPGAERHLGKRLGSLPTLAQTLDARSKGPAGRARATVVSDGSAAALFAASESYRDRVVAVDGALLPRVAHEPVWRVDWGGQDGGFVVVTPVLTTSHGPTVRRLKAADDEAGALAEAGRLAAAYGGTVVRSRDVVEVLAPPRFDDVLGVGLELHATFPSVMERFSQGSEPRFGMPDGFPAGFPFLDWRPDPWDDEREATLRALVAFGTLPASGIDRDAAAAGARAFADAARLAVGPDSFATRWALQAFGYGSGSALDAWKALCERDPSLAIGVDEEAEAAFGM